MREWLTALVILTCVPLTGQAQSDEDTAMATGESAELVRLPGDGEVKTPGADSGRKSERLLPGGGLFLSFDADGDGRVSPDEVERGIHAAFLEADSDGSGYLTAFEQQAWAGELPTRDNSLANPVRFDPNLDRRVSPEEFHAVIAALADDYAGEDGTVEMASLRAPGPSERERPRRSDPGDTFRPGPGLSRHP